MISKNNTALSCILRDQNSVLSNLMQPLVTPQSLTLILAKGSTGGAVGKG